MLRFEKVATPLVSATVVVPESVPALGFVPIATVTVPVKLVIVVLSSLSTVTVGAGVMKRPAGVLVGCVVKTSLPGSTARKSVKFEVNPPSPPGSTNVAACSGCGRNSARARSASFPTKLLRPACATIRASDPALTNELHGRKPASTRARISSDVLSGRLACAS